MKKTCEVVSLLFVSLVLSFNTCCSIVYSVQTYRQYKSALANRLAIEKAIKEGKIKPCQSCGDKSAQKSVAKVAPLK